MPDAAEFDRLATEFYPVWFRYHPELASQAGVQVAHPLLPTQDDDDLAALRAWLEELILGLDEIDFTALEADRQLDFELMAGAARVEHQESLIRDWRRVDPLRLLPVGEIRRLTQYEPQTPGAATGKAPATPLDTALGRLLGQIPEHLRQTQAHLGEVAAHLSPALVRAAAREAQRRGGDLRDLARGPWLRRHCQDTKALEALAESAADALNGFAHHAAEALAARTRGGAGCGREHLRLRLLQLHFIDCDPLASHDPIAQALLRTEAALGDLAEPPDGGRGEGATPTDAAPGPGEFAWPLDGRLPAPPGHPSAGGGSRLPAFADRARTARRPRQLANAVTLAMGWHLYLLDRTAGASGAGGDEQWRGLTIRRGLIRRAQLDLDLHAGRIDDQQALTRLRDEGLDGPAADAALTRLARHPGDALAGVLGWLLLEAARQHQEAWDGPAFEERHFHDRLLSQGPIPLPLALRYGLGPALWEAAAGTVLPG